MFVLRFTNEAVGQHRFLQRQAPAHPHPCIGAVQDGFHAPAIGGGLEQEDLPASGRLVFFVDRHRIVRNALPVPRIAVRHPIRGSAQIRQYFPAAVVDAYRQFVRMAMQPSARPVFQDNGLATVAQQADTQIRE